MATNDENMENGDDEKEIIDEEKQNDAIKKWMKVHIKLSTKRSVSQLIDQEQWRNRTEQQKLSNIQEIKTEEEETGSKKDFFRSDNANCENEAPDSKYSTDAFGEIKFVGYGQKIAKFARVDFETSADTIVELITTQWNLPLPKLYISVTGGRKHFQLKSHREEAFGHGLVKAARSTGAWVISAGLHDGVVKYIGKAIHDNECSLIGNNKVVTISIASWNHVQNKESLKNENGSWPADYHIENQSDQNVCALDPNHSHFILVDNGTSKSSNEEINFRKMLENSIKEKKIRESGEVKIPSVVVMVEGGFGTLKSVCDSMSRNIPVIIVKGSGRAADIMAYAYQKMLEDVDDDSLDISYGSIQENTRDDIREKITKIAKIFEKNLETDEINNLVDCVLTSLKQPNLLTLYDIDSAEDFDISIMKAVFKANNKLDNLWLALEWNRIDIVKSEIFTDGTCWPQPDELANFMLFALREDRVDFVKLFMEYGVSLKEFLTEENIKDLYSMESKDISIKDGVSLFHKLMYENALLQKKADQDSLSAMYHSDLPFATILFLWAVFLGRKEMAFLFWKEGMEALPSALVANKLLKSLKLKCKDYDKMVKLQEHADLYEERAIGILTECYHADEKRTLDLLLLQWKTWNDASCMQIAFNVNNKKFVSQPVCQSLLTNIWMGSMSTNNSIFMLLLCTLCPLFIFLIDFDDEKDNYKRNNKSNHSQNTKTCLTCLCKMFSRFVLFYSTPVIKFLTNLIFYIIFLCIYSYVLLVELKPQTSYLEWLLFVWVIGIFTEEIHQILIKGSMSLWIRFTNYINDFWNIIDVITISLFVLGIIFRFLQEMDATRLVFNLNLISFYIRILYMLSVHRHLGPKLVMIKKMMQDLGYFIIIMFVFMIAFGIASQSMLYPSTPVSYDLFKSVFRKAYFHMYGELFLDEYEENIKSKLVTYIAPVLMCLYILIMHILLLNLLIAMFSFTFQKVQEKGYLHWSFQRYDLIYEFCVRPPLPPPFILISNIYQFYHLCRRYIYVGDTSQKYSVFSKQFDANGSKSLILWEDQMVESYISKKDISVKDSLYDKVISSSNRIDQLTSKVEELQHNLEEKMKNVDKIDTILALLKEKL